MRDFQRIERPDPCVLPGAEPCKFWLGFLIRTRSRFLPSTLHESSSATLSAPVPDAGFRDGGDRCPVAPREGLVVRDERAAADGDGESEAPRVPGFRTWGGVYLFVFGAFLLLVVALALFSRAFA